MAKGWNNVVDGNQFQAASEAAMFHLMSSLSKPDNTESAAANEYRRQGAMAYLDTLKNLNSENQPKKQNDRDNLQR